MPSGTSLSANQGANAIIITDTKANIRRMAQLVKALDTASVSASGVRVFALTYADATALAQVVTQLFQTDSNQSGRNRMGFPGFPGFGGDRDVATTIPALKLAAWPHRKSLPWRTKGAIPWWWPGPKNS